MTNWFLNGTPVALLSDLPDYDKLKGFVYRITNRDTGEIYIGKKALYHATKKKRSAKETNKLGITRTVHRVLRGQKESDWKTYYGSCARLKADVKALGKERFLREILELCCSKKYMSYAEVFYQMREGVLARPSYNDNIAGSFYRKDACNCCDPDEEPTLDTA
jgi:hypothetical protein